MILADDPGLGKAQPLDANILTPTGWVAMGALKVGDQVVGRNGKACRVTGVFPQGERDVYKVHFTDGAVVECCDEHLWAVQNHNDRRRGGKFRVLPLSVIRQTIRRVDQTSARNWYVPLPEPVEYALGELSLPLDPYVLGCLLGDGGITKATLLSSADLDLIEEVARRLPGGAQVRKCSYGNYDYAITGEQVRYNPVRSALIELGLLGADSFTKFIPERYLQASVRDRLDLLRGLLDTDGHVRPKDNNVEFVSVSPRLAQDLVSLVRSLGGIARMRPKRFPQCYRVTVQMPGDVNPFFLARKAEVYRPRTKYPPSKAIDRVEWSRRTEVQCIAVDAEDRLYVTDGFVVTHNTGTTLMALRWLKEAGIVTRTLLVCPPKLMYQWVSEAEKWLGDSLRCLVVDGTPAQRKRTYDLLEKHDGHPLHHVDIVICSYPILRNDVKELVTLRFDQFVADEASSLKNYAAAQTKAAVKVVDGIVRRLAISATPFQNKLDEYHSVFTVVHPDVLGSRDAFLSKYCNTAQFPVQVRGRTIYITTITGYRSLDVFKQTVAPYVLQRTIEEVGGQMPALTILPPRWVDLKPAQRSRYDEVESGILQLDPNQPGTLLEAIQRVVRLQQIVNLPSVIFPSETDSAKLDELHDLLTGELSGRQVVIFSKQLEFLKQGVLPMLADLGKSVCQIHGEMDNREAERHRVEFQAGQRDIAVITTAGEMGLNLDAAAYMVCCDLLFNEARMRQVYARIRRASSTHANAVIYRLLAKDTLEERVIDLLEQRGAMLDFLDSPSMYDSGSFQDLMRLVNRKISLLD